MKYNFNPNRVLGLFVFTIIYMRLARLYSFFRWTEVVGEKMF